MTNSTRIAISSRRTVYFHIARCHLTRAGPAPRGAPGRSQSGTSRYSFHHSSAGTSFNGPRPRTPPCIRLLIAQISGSIQTGAYGSSRLHDRPGPSGSRSFALRRIAVRIAILHRIDRTRGCSRLSVVRPRRTLERAVGRGRGCRPARRTLVIDRSYWCGLDFRRSSSGSPDRTAVLRLDPRRLHMFMIAV